MKNINFPSKQKIYQCIKQYTLRNISNDDQEIKNFIKSQLKFWTLYKYKFILKKLIYGSLKTITIVDKEYTQVWSSDYYPGNALLNRKYFVSWNEKISEVYGWAEKRVHLLIISEILKNFKIKNFLEVGCGNGAMLMMLSTLHPNINFYGTELTLAGIKSAKKLQKLKNLPKAMIEFIPDKIKDPYAFKKIKFVQGNAINLPYENKKFDFVGTSLALEQMKPIQDDALKEIARVSKDYVGMLEPFPDFNQTKLQKTYTTARDYFSVPICELSKFGFEVIEIFSDFPSKIYRGAGFVLLKKSKS